MDDFVEFFVAVLLLQACVTLLPIALGRARRSGRGLLSVLAAPLMPFVLTLALVGGFGAGIHVGSSVAEIALYLVSRFDQISTEHAEIAVLVLVPVGFLGGLGVVYRSDTSSRGSR